jgi:hypothetical protein
MVTPDRTTRLISPAILVDGASNNLRMAAVDRLVIA